MIECRIITICIMQYTDANNSLHHELLQNNLFKFQMLRKCFYGGYRIHSAHNTAYKIAVGIRIISIVRKQY